MGFAVLVIGVILSIPGVPGPGLPLILLGLWVLSDHFTWARKGLEWIKSKLPGRRAPCPKSSRADVPADQDGTPEGVGKAVETR